MGRGNVSNRLLGQNTPFAVREAFNSLRTNLMYTVKGDDGCPIYGITSYREGAGKSTVIANLAISFCYTSQKVLLIDSDMRHSTQCGLFGLDEDHPGLSELLSKIEPDDSKVIQHIPSLSLDVVTAGQVPPNPSELIMSDRFNTLLEKWRQKYDVIFIDFPPVGIVTDALAPSKTVTGYIMTVRAEKDNVQKVNETIAAIRSVDAKILGVVVNGVDAKGMYHNHAYGYEKKKSGKSH